MESYLLVLRIIFFYIGENILFVIHIGPSEHAMWALGETLDQKNFFSYFGFYFIGDKIASTILAQSVDVPTLPWSGARKYNDFIQIEKAAFETFLLRREIRS
jgi:hypothetical protein